jgi:hypothetical protein
LAPLHSSVLRSSQLSLGFIATMTSADFPEALTPGLSLGQCWFFPLAPSGSTEFSLMTVGLCVCSSARPLFPASLPVRVPTVESLSSALSVGPLRFLPSRLTTVVVTYPVRNFHPDRPSTCQAHERGIHSAGTSAAQGGARGSRGSSGRGVASCELKFAFRGLRREIGSGCRDCARQPSHTTVCAVFSVRRLNRA